MYPASLCPCTTNFRSSIRSAVFLALATAAAGAQAAAAQDDKGMEEVVVTAAGFEQKIVDAPASISVVTAEELMKRPSITLIDAVRELEGVDVGETSDKTGQRTISIRGMGSDYTLVLIDGKRQNNHGDIYPNSFGGNQFNHIPPLDAIERIEVIRGPASTLYGADALGGVINIITKKNDNTWRTSATIGRAFQENDAFGEDTTYDLSLHGPILRDTLNFSLRASRYERDASHPEYDLITDPAGQTHERALGFGGGGKTTDNVNEAYGATLSWNISPRQHLSLDFDTSELVYDNTPYTNNLGTTAYPLGTVDNVSELWRAAPRAGYAADQRFTRDQWSVTHRGEWGFAGSFVSLAYINTGNHGRTLPLTAAERQLHTQLFQGTGPYEGLSVAERRAIMEEAFLPRPKRTMESRQYTFDAKLDFQLEGLGGRHHLVTGMQIIDGELEDGVFGMESGDDGGNTVQKHQMYSLFAENNWTPIEPLTVTMGVRYDDHKVFGDHMSPRAYAVYTINPSWSIKGGVATGFKTPRTTDLYDGITGFGGQGTTPFVGNPDLKPETSVNTELAVYWTAESGDHNFNVTYFRNDFKDKIARGESNQSCEMTGGVRPCANLGAYSALGYTTYAQNINIDEARIRGAEIAGRYRILNRLWVRANYTYLDSKQTSGPEAGLPLTDTAKHMANAALEWAVSDSFSTQLTWEARSKRFRDVDDDGNALYYKAYDVLHLGAQYRFRNHVTVNARIQNLLDRDFTSFQTAWTDNGDGTWTPAYVDDYNNKDKARNYWLSVNFSF
jgi:outer membrane receptor for ferrienterochelin and colicins